MTSENKNQCIKITYDYWNSTSNKEVDTVDATAIPRKTIHTFLHFEKQEESKVP
jgi:hypothetical protein